MTISKYSIYLEWTGVDREDMNGIPLGYVINCFLSNKIIATYTVDFSTRRKLIDQLEPSSLYMFDVCAYNSVGNGPFQRVTGVTMNSGKFTYSLLPFFNMQLHSNLDVSNTRLVELSMSRTKQSVPSLSIYTK